MQGQSWNPGKAVKSPMAVEVAQSPEPWQLPSRNRIGRGIESGVRQSNSGTAMWDRGVPISSLNAKPNTHPGTTFSVQHSSQREKCPLSSWGDPQWLITVSVHWLLWLLVTYSGLRLSLLSNWAIQCVQTPLSVSSFPYNAVQCLIHHRDLRTACSWHS